MTIGNCKLVIKFDQHADLVLIQVLKNPSIGTAEDKLRLFVIYYLSTSDLPDNELQQYIEALQVGRPV